MDTLSVEVAQQFLDEHFKLFLEKQKEAGYDCQIILNNNDMENSRRHFYVRFCKESECSKCYKIIC